MNATKSSKIAGIQRTGLKMVFRGFLASLLGTLVMACSGCGGGGGGGASTGIPVSTTSSATTPTTKANIGFFTASGVPPEIIPNVGFTNIGATSTTQIASSLQSAQGTSFKVNIDFTEIATQPMSTSAIEMTYHDLTGTQYTKQFAPILPPPKLKQFGTNAQIAAALDPYFDVLKQYAPNVGIIFLADEPYLNGISKSELERAGAVARQELNARGLQNVKLGVIFAGGMFDSKFATQMDRESGKYAQKWDYWRQYGESVLTGTVTDPSFDKTAFQQWVASFGTSRLTTYDLAGNMYAGGGIPQGFDVVGFDLYLSTILLDGTYDDSLSWFAANFPNAGCSQFAGETVTQVRSQLSFFTDGQPLVGKQYQNSDRAILDAMYQCRMRATFTMLENDLAAGGQNVQLLMISESSANGVREFDALGNPQPTQPTDLVNSRVLDEVIRAENFYSAKEFAAGLSYFTYDDEFDHSINESIAGVASVPDALASIYQFSRTGTPTPRQGQ